ncbi:MAG: hypothetical protein GX567_18270 [Clostridia bacterium]|nr:hypothetical protein [Clostridia bacterium]
MKKTLIKETDHCRTYDVEADSMYDFVYEEAEERCKELEKRGPYAPNQERPFVTVKQLIPLFIVLGICVGSHVWAMISISMY